MATGTVAQSAAFKQAVIDSKKLTAKPTNDELLELYALYKIGTGELFDDAPKPGIFDVRGKAKYSAWQATASEEKSPENAQKKYVELVEQLKNKYGFDANKNPEAVGSS